MYLPIKMQKELLSTIVNKIEYDRRIKSSGTYDRNAPCLNALFVIDENKYFVVYSPNATDSFGDEHFGDIALEIFEYEENVYLNYDITSEDYLLDELDENL